MHILAPNGTAKTYPYSVGQLMAENPQVSFPENPTDELLASYGVYSVAATDRPAYDSITQNLTEAAPALVGGVWMQKWVVSAASNDEVAARKADALAYTKELRSRAYRDEADPLFFKAQRNEATIEEWQAKVTEIKARFPYPAE
jgi:hypothetical protein